eukprot:SAG31_NODE_12910_length_907_cov_0.948020_1_plen_137_part_00
MAGLVADGLGYCHSFRRPRPPNARKPERDSRKERSKGEEQRQREHKTKQKQSAKHEKAKPQPKKDASTSRKLLEQTGGVTSSHVAAANGQLENVDQEHSNLNFAGSSGSIGEGAGGASESRGTTAAGGGGRWVHVT